MSHAIPTVYEGIEYRSRLEARWAAMFDNLGWKFTYEPFDTNGYIPDFLIHGDASMLVEIKPAVDEAEYRAPIDKITRGLKGHWTRDVLILGADPLPNIDNQWGYDMPSAGLLGEYFEHDSGRTLGGIRIDATVYDQLTPELRQKVEWTEFPGPVWDFESGQWFRCGKCRAICIFHSYQSYGGRPCGHYNGDHYMESIDPGDIRWMWSQACNAVKWRRGAAHEPPLSPPSWKDFHRVRSEPDRRRIDPGTGEINAPIPEIAPHGIDQESWRTMPMEAKQQISNIVAGIAS